MDQHVLLPQVPDFVNAKVNGEPALDVIGDREWFENEFTPRVATRGGALIKKWGRSSAASTAVSVADAIRALVEPTRPGDCFSSGVASDGNPYGVPDGLMFSFPLRSNGDGNWEFVRARASPPAVFRKPVCDQSLRPRRASIAPHLLAQLRFPTLPVLL